MRRRVSREPQTAKEPLVIDNGSLSGADDPLLVRFCENSFVYFYSMFLSTLSSSCQAPTDDGPTDKTRGVQPVKAPIIAHRPFPCFFLHFAL
jgi:hypothetical protein